MNFTDENFKVNVLQSELPVLVDFWAPWCAPCRAIAPVIDQLAVQYEGKLRVGKLNIDEAQQIANDLNIRSIPTLIIFKGGKPVWSIVGGVSKAMIEGGIDNVIGA